MYAIIQSGGHQIRVTKGGTAIVAGTVGEPGDAVTLEQVLLVEKDGGSLMIGSKGTLFTRTWHGGENEKNNFVLLPRKQFEQQKGQELQ